MLSTGELLRRSSLCRCILAIILACMNVWWTSAGTLAEEAAPAPSTMTKRSTWERPGSNQAPHLVIGMRDGGDTSLNRPLRLDGDDAANPSATNRISRPDGPAAPLNRAEKGESGPLVLSSLFEPTTGIHGLLNYHAENTSPRSTIQVSPDYAGLKVNPWPDEGPALELLAHGYPMEFFLSAQELANSESSAPEMEHRPLPFVQLNFDGWQLPVVLSSAAISP